MSNEEQPYCMVVTNDDGHAVMVKACESQQEFIDKHGKYQRQGYKVHGFPADEFEGFDKDL